MAHVADLCERFRHPVPQRGSGLGVAALMLVGSLLVLPVLALRPPAAEQELAIVFAPGTTREMALERLAGLNARAVRAGTFENVLVVRFSRDLGWGALWRSGALATFDPAAFGSCFVTSGADR